MVVHICSNCNKVFNKKSTYDYHIKNKKNPCINNNVYMTTNNNNNNILITHNSTQTNTQPINNPLNNPHNSHNNINTNNIDKYQCIYCNLVCSRSDSLNRHVEKYCKKPMTTAKEQKKLINRLLPNKETKDTALSSFYSTKFSSLFEPFHVEEKKINFRRSSLN